MILSKNNAGGSFTPHPATDGLVRGVIVDITPPEKKQTPFGEKEQSRFVIESEVEKAPGERFAVWSKGFVPSLHEKAGFRKFLKSAFGRDVAETDCDASGNLDVDSLCIGHAVQMIIVHEDSGENTYANISYIGPDKSGNPLKPSGKHVRKQDRPKDDKPAGNGQQQATSKPAQADAATAHYGVSSNGPDWRTAIIPAGRHQGKQLQDLRHDELPDFLTQYLDWFDRRVQPSPQDQQFAVSVRMAKAYMVKVDPDDDIPF